MGFTTPILANWLVEFDLILILPDGARQDLAIMPQKHSINGGRNVEKIQNSAKISDSQEVAVNEDIAPDAVIAVTVGRRGRPPGRIEGVWIKAWRESWGLTRPEAVKVFADAVGSTKSPVKRSSLENWETDVCKITDDWITYFEESLPTDSDIPAIKDFKRRLASVKRGDFAKQLLSSDPLSRANEVLVWEMLPIEVRSALGVLDLNPSRFKNWEDLSRSLAYEALFNRPEARWLLLTASRALGTDKFADLVEQQIAHDDDQAEQERDREISQAVIAEVMAEGLEQEFYLALRRRDEEAGGLIRLESQPVKHRYYRAIGLLAHRPHDWNCLTRIGIVKLQTRIQESFERADLRKKVALLTDTELESLRGSQESSRSDDEGNNGGGE